MEPTEPSVAEVHAERVLEAVRNGGPRRAIVDWKLWAAVAGTFFAFALVMALFIVQRQLGANRDISECRAEIESQLREADSEVIRTNAILKEFDSGITVAWSAIIEQLANRETDFTLNLAKLHDARLAAEHAGDVLNAAITGQVGARVRNRNIVALCPS